MPADGGGAASRWSYGTGPLGDVDDSGGRLVQVAQQDGQALALEQRLLRRVVALARRCDGSLPVSVLDGLLAGTGPVRPARPAQHRTAAPPFVSVAPLS